ncbi:MAG: DUF7133 domain-containing protein, partial [Fimbriiglobus sp.]
KPARPGEYVKKATRSETVRATLASFGLPNLEGKWHFAGPFDFAGGAGFDAAYPPEKGYDSTAQFTGKDGTKFGWAAFPGFELGKVVDLAKLFPKTRSDAVVYLFTEFESAKPMTLPLSFGSDDTLSVWVNGQRLIHEQHVRPAAPDQDHVDAKLVAGKNTLLVKIGQGDGGWEVYVSPDAASALPPGVVKRIDRDFPTSTGTKGTSATAEAKHYSVFTLPQPSDCVLEVGGLGFRPDGKLLACTRRGDVWLVHNPQSTNPAEIKFTRFATGLHEALGLHVVDNNTVYVTQRPELTKLVDRDGDGVADEYTTVSDKWGVSGDYHEFAFGPAVDPQGNMFVSLNVGFGGGDQAKAAWRGWCVKIDPKTGSLEPWSYGLRSPNGINFSPDGELFYCDNQGEWVASNKMHHLKKGKFYGHQAGLRWVKDSPFAGVVSDKVESNLRYDGVGEAPAKKAGFPAIDPPCIWFPYGRMGQSVTEPRWDTTAGKFGPFAGQCFVGDQTRSLVMRVALETVNGVYQGAAFPFRSGLQCGVNRIVFGPDGAMYVGQTARGWGSVGGKPYGLQRINFTGEVPFEMHHVVLTATGFDVTFTKPVDPATVTKAAASVQSFTYLYASQYGYPETDTRAETVAAAELSKDGKTLSLAVPGLRKGRVYELRLSGVTSAAGDPLLHPEAYYTLNELVKPKPPAE